MDRLPQKVAQVFHDSFMYGFINLPEAKAIYDILSKREKDKEMCKIAAELFKLSGYPLD
jgi:hypothetical protein